MGNYLSEAFIDDENSECGVTDDELCQFATINV